MRHFTVAALLTLLVILSACGGGSEGNNKKAAQVDGAPQRNTETSGTAQYGDSWIAQYGENTDVSGVKPADVLVDNFIGEQVGVAPRGADIPESDFDPDSLQTVVDYLEYVIQNNDQVWTQYFLDTGLQEPAVSYELVMPGETFTSRCELTPGEPLTVDHDFPNAFYCRQDELNPGHQGALILPVTTMAKMWTGDILGKQSQQAGDFAAAIVTAHEFGHHVVDEMKIQYSQRAGVEILEPTGKYNELIADCMAGAWAASVYYQGRLEAGDFEEATSALELVGDYEILSPLHHGTPEEREEALRDGFFGIPNVTGPARPDGCIGKYWVTAS